MIEIFFDYTPPEVVGVDINPVYLQRLVERFPHPSFDLDVQCTDLVAYGFELGGSYSRRVSF